MNLSSIVFLTSQCYTTYGFLDAPVPTEIRTRVARLPLPIGDCFPAVPGVEPYEKFVDQVLYFSFRQAELTRNLLVELHLGEQLDGLRLLAVQCHLCYRSSQTGEPGVERRRPVGGCSRPPLRTGGTGGLSIFRHPTFHFATSVQAIPCVPCLNSLVVI